MQPNSLFSTGRGLAGRLLVRLSGATLPALTTTFPDLPAAFRKAYDGLYSICQEVVSLGIQPGMDEFEQRKLRIFNQLNLVGVLTGMILPLVGVFSSYMPALAFVVAFSPALVAVLVLLCNHVGNYRTGQLYFFTLFPVFTSLPYAANMDVGVELFFILYGVLSVFFLPRLSHTILCFSFSAFFYLLITGLSKDYAYKLSDAHFHLYFLNHLLAILFIFYGLYLIKRENTGYQQSLQQGNEVLSRTNAEVNRQRVELAYKASLLERQTAQLHQLDSLKNKLFSVIAHDLKGPMYALRNLFQLMQQHNMPAEEVKAMLPEITKDVNQTTSLMDNLLQWAKLQMQANPVQTQAVEVTDLIHTVQQTLRLQAEAKGVVLELKGGRKAYCLADPEMARLVLRNLVSNAIKFTPERGTVTVGVIRKREALEIFVKDTGVGMNRDQLQKLQEQNFFTTNGTANESGTGLGLMLCREFLGLNGGALSIKSREGKGSTFSFLLPAAEMEEC